MRDKDLYAQILGIKSPWCVSNVELALSKGEVTVHVEQEDDALQCCFANALYFHLGGLDLYPEGVTR